MLDRIVRWRQVTGMGVILLLGACAQHQPQAVSSNPPPISPGPNATWYHVRFDTDSDAISADGQKTINDVMIYLEHNPAAAATLIGKTDTVGGKDYNMHLSHRRADAVRDSLVYGGHVAADRVETRWTGENRQHVPTGNDVAEAANRTVDIAIH